MKKYIEKIKASKNIDELRKIMREKDCPINLIRKEYSPEKGKYIVLELRDGSLCFLENIEII